MKKTLLAVIFGLVLSVGPFLFAQNTARESDMYYVSTPVEKIYSHRDGYVVTYRKGVNQMARLYIPMDWFTDPTGKADLVALGPGGGWPYLAIYYNKGEFSHIRLYVRRNKSHETWGVVPLNVDISEYFEGVEEIKLEF